MTAATLTLADFLLARIAEDEAVAVAMRDCHDPLDWTPARDWPPALGLAGPVDGPSGYESIVIDPDRVLAECEAKRRIVERHAPRDLPAPACRECGGFTAAVSEESGIVHSGYLVPWPCPTLLDLAAVYADHSDFQEEWRP